MYDVIGLRNLLVGRLYRVLMTPVVPNDDSPRPEKPFLAYTITSPYIPQAAPPVIGYEDLEVDGESWVRKQRTEYPTVVFSFTAVAGTMADSYTLALDAREWFALRGRQALKDQEVIVARIGSVQDRSLILDETEAEYRAGFDVVLRVCSRVSIDIETIEMVEYGSTRSDS